ncbi:MAG: serine/threonine protein kinase [Candidatus Eisenbacteria bacterium]|nr:serine/threonine protein kinase [Candidatus Eisenbacteria bacterium]
MRRYEAAKSIFVRALELPEGEREAFVRREAGHDRELQREVEELFAFNDEPGELEAQPLPDTAPERIGPWQIVRELGRGGIGVVYLARRADGPPVALKVLRGGLLSPVLVARFRREAAVLARLDHPGIARAIETGLDEGPVGPRPWLAMELIQGEDLRAWSAREHGLEARLELMARVCDAAEHAHTQGVVHRDLKPENILVRPDGSPVVLDFGVARLVDSDLRATTLHTNAGELLGTIRYMSPEQADARPEGIGPRSDVHQLAVLTYELMTGRLPFEVPEHSVHRALVAVLTAPPRPMDELPVKLRRPLERLLRAALVKDPAHRLASAALLAADLRRIAGGRAPLARAPREDAGRWLAAGRNSVMFAAAVGALLWVFGFLGPPPSPLDWASGALAPAHVFRRAMNEADSAAVRLHFNTRSLPRLREARAHVLRSLALLRTVARQPWCGQVRGLVQFRLGEAEYLIAERTYDADLYERAAASWSSAGTTLRTVRIAAQPDTLGIVAGQALTPLGTETWKSAAMALDDLARLRDPETAHARALEIRRQGLREFRPGAPPDTLLRQPTPGTSDERSALAGWLQGVGAGLARLGYDRSDSSAALQGLLRLRRAISLVESWLDGAAFASLEHDLGSAYLGSALLTHDHALLDSALVRLADARRLRADLPGYTSVIYSSRELARAHRLAAWWTADPGRQVRHLELALTALEAPGGGDVVLAAQDLALLSIGRAEVLVDLACVERNPARLDQAARALDESDRALTRERAPVIATQEDFQRLRISAQRFAIGGLQGQAIRTRQVLDRLHRNTHGLSPRTRWLATRCSQRLDSGPPRRFDLRYPMAVPF